jgi:hypothetical protein
VSYGLEDMVLQDTEIMCSNRCCKRFSKGNRFEKHELIKWQQHKLFVTFQFCGDN